jgi:hypothetical protein
MGELIQLPRHARLCFDCRYGHWNSSSGVWCVQFNEYIVNERLAEECELFLSDSQTPSQMKGSR